MSHSLALGAGGVGGGWGWRVMKPCPSQLRLSAKLCLPGDQIKFRAIELFCSKHKSCGPIWHCAARLPRCLHMDSFPWLLCLSRIYESFCSQQRSFDLPVLLSVLLVHLYLLVFSIYKHPDSRTL